MTKEGQYMILVSQFKIEYGKILAPVGAAIAGAIGAKSSPAKET